MACFVPSFNSAGEAGLPVRWAGFATVGDAELASHGALLLADVSGAAGVRASPVSRQELQTTLIDAWPQATNRLDRSALSGFSESKRVRMDLVHILLIAALLLQVRDERDRLVGGAHAVLRHDVDQRALHVLRHALGVAADVDMRAVGKPGPQIAPDLAHAVLHVEFLLAVARPGERKPRQHALRFHAGELVLVEEVVSRALMSKEQPVAPAGLGGHAL